MIVGFCFCFFFVVVFFGGYQGWGLRLVVIKYPSYPVSPNPLQTFCFLLLMSSSMQIWHTKGGYR